MDFLLLEESCHFYFMSIGYKKHDVYIKQIIWC